MSGTLRDNRGQKKPEFQVGQTVYAIKSRTHYGSADVVEYQIEKITSDPQWMSAYTMVGGDRFSYSELHTDRKVALGILLKNFLYQSQRNIINMERLLQDARKNHDDIVRITMDLTAFDWLESPE